MATLGDAIAKLHKRHRLPHIIVTSVRFDPSSPTISIVGSTMRTDCSHRLFKIDVPAIDCFFSGTGDMFAALTVVRLREATSRNNLASTKSWVSPDDVEAINLPLAKAAEKILGSIQAVLEKTKNARDEVLEGMSSPMRDMQKDSEKRLHLRKTKAAEVMIVRNQDDLRDPQVLYRAEPLSSGDTVSNETEHSSSDFKDQVDKGEDENSSQGLRNKANVVKHG